MAPKSTCVRDKWIKFLHKQSQRQDSKRSWCILHSHSGKSFGFALEEASPISS